MPQSPTPSSRSFRSIVSTLASLALAVGVGYALVHGERAMLLERPVPMVDAPGEAAPAPEAPASVVVQVAAAVLTSISPTNGTAGTPVTIVGENFGGQFTYVWFGPALVPVISGNTTHLLVSAPPGSGSVLVEVQLNGISQAKIFTYNPAPVGPPTINRLSPPSGSTAGGTRVIIDGTDLQGVTAVMFGSNASTLANSTPLTVIAPPGSGTVDVRAVTPAGTSAVSTATKFTYEPNTATLPTCLTRPVLTFSQTPTATTFTWTPAILSDVSVVPWYQLVLASAGQSSDSRVVFKLTFDIDFTTVERYADDFVADLQAELGFTETRFTPASITTARETAARNGGTTGLFKTLAMPDTEPVRARVRVTDADGNEIATCTSDTSTTQVAPPQMGIATAVASNGASFRFTTPVDHVRGEQYGVYGASYENDAWQTEVLVGVVSEAPNGAVSGLTPGKTYRLRLKRNHTGASPVVSNWSNPFTTSASVVRAIDPEITWVLPSWDQYLSSNSTEFATMVGNLRSRIGDSPGGKAKIGLSRFVGVTMSDWTVDPTDRTAVRAALATSIATVDAMLAKMTALPVADRMPIGLSLITAIRATTDPVQIGAQAEDRRNVQWYQDANSGTSGNYTDAKIASGWVTYSRYATKLRRVQEAYVREFGRYLAEKMIEHPTLLVAVTGDGETEMTFDRFTTFDTSVLAQADRAIGDYSPFAIAEFRDWLRGRGAYDTGQPLAEQGYPNAARYYNDVSPNADSLVSPDGHTLNGDLGTAFTSWELLYWENAWSGTSNPSNPINTNGQAVPVVAGGFDAPRTIPFTADGGLAAGDAWWRTWIRFRQEMIWRYNIDFARWMTTSGTAQSGSIPGDRFYSAQVPADKLFTNSSGAPNDTGLRLLTGASPYWTAVVAPWGASGVTGYNANIAGCSVSAATCGLASLPGLPVRTQGAYNATALFPTTPNVAPLIAPFGRWGIVEWNPADPWATEATPYRADNDVVRQYRPSLLMPYKLGSDHWRVLTEGGVTSGFETGLLELMQGRTGVAGLENQASIGSPGGWSPVVTWRTPRRVLINTTLSSTQLTASASVPGVFKYSPAMGATMSTAGSQTLSVTFTPDDPAYTEVTKTVTLQVDPLPSMTVTPNSTRRFVGNRAADGAVTGITPAQFLTVSFNVPGNEGWTATKTVPWVTLSNGSGIGSGIFSIGVDAAAFRILFPTINTATTTVTIAGVAGSVTEDTRVQTVTVQVDLTPPAQDSKPQGQVDTPSQDVAGVQGSVGLTGWAVDDRGVSAVTIYRNCVAPETIVVAPCQPITDHARNVTYNLVLLGSANFIAGARPDIEALFPTLPQNNRGGWGFLILTSMLPNVTTGATNGGQGPLSLYAIATDTAGQNALLGRTFNPVAPGYNDPSRMTMDNASIGKPFGAIDTPVQGDTVSGIVNNFGWALTPDRNTTSGDTGATGDIDIRQPGPSTVFVDSLPLGQITFNFCRGSVGNPVPLTSYCDDDVSNIFGNATPRAVLTPRTANTTLFRNLDRGRGPIGLYVVDSTQLSNAVHTIQWAVYDNEGRSEGVGSRYFTVLNAGSDPALAGRPAAVSNDEAVAQLRTSQARIVGDAAQLRGLSPRTEGVRGRTGFQLDVPYSALGADESGAFRARIELQDRIEIDLGGAVDTGYLQVDGTLRPLPLGSTLLDGRFHWGGMPGYLGDYDLVFVKGGERVDVTIEIVDESPATTEPTAAVHMHLDDARVVGAGTVEIGGWAYDPKSGVGAGIGAVHVWAKRIDVGGVQTPVFLGEATIDGRRPDVAAAFADAPGTAGFGLRAALAPGTYEISSYVWVTRTRQFEDARTVTITVR